MIRFCIGRPGSGKGIYAIQLIVDELCFTDRHVMTNLPFLRGELNEWIQKHRPALTVDVNTRLHLLDDYQVGEFWRWRGAHVLDEPPPDKDGPNKLDQIEYGVRMKRIFDVAKDQLAPVTFVIDETQDYFAARHWATNGRHVLYYVTKHRHLSDDVWFMTQSPENVEKQLKLIAGEVHVMRNQYMQQFGWFRRRGCFVRKSYYSFPTRSSVPYMAATFSLNVQLANCYKTTGALGLTRAPEAKPRNRAPLPFWSIFLMGGLALAAMWYALLHAPDMLNQLFMTGGQRAIAQTVPTASPSIPAPLPARSAALQNLRTVDGMAEPFALEKPVYVRSVVRFGGRVVVTLTDGRQYTEKDRELQAIDSRGVTIAGRYHLMAPPGPGRRAQPGEALPAVPAPASDSPALSLTASTGAYRRGADGVDRITDSSVQIGATPSHVSR